MSAQPLDAIIVGAGFSGLYMLHRLRQRGFNAKIFEAADGVGGTWYWNRYPGARCDIESMQYSYQFDEDLQQEWAWKERYAAQPDILSYIEHVAERFDLKRDIQFRTRVRTATFDEEANHWRVHTEAGEQFTARFLILAVGCLSTAIAPSFPGQSDFEQPVYHTGRWPHEPVDFTGKTVGVIGTGSSAVQCIPVIAEVVRHLFVFQRTPNYVVPAQNRTLSAGEVEHVKRDYAGFRAMAKQRMNAFVFPFHPESALSVSAEERQKRFDEQWLVGGLPFLGAFGDLLTNTEANAAATAYCKEKIREIVANPGVAELLTPKDHVFGCKRLCSGTNYYETFNRENVTLVDVSGDKAIERFTATGLRAGGRDYSLDAIILATGFDAMTGSVTRIGIAGRNGATIQDRWRDGPSNYLGVAVHGFPNMFNMVGVGGPSVLATMVTCSEQHGDWIADLIGHMRERGIARFEPRAEAEAAWGGEVAAAAGRSLRSSCNSWYLGSNVEGKPRVFMPYIGGFPKYVETCNREAANSYPGLSFSA